MSGDYWKQMPDPWRRYPDRPLVDDVTDELLDDAVDDLIVLRAPCWQGDAGAVLHALASLRDQITTWLPDTIADARDQDYDWAEIGQLLGVSTRAAQRLHTRRTPREAVPIDAD